MPGLQVHDPIVTPRTNMATASYAAFCFNYIVDEGFLAVLKSKPNTLVRAKGVTIWQLQVLC
jgi:hypothetical protein